MCPSLVDEIAPEFSELLRSRGLRVTKERIEPDHFGDALVEASSVDFRLRLVRDRGQLLVEVAPPIGGDWHYLDYVLEFIDPTTRRNDPGSLPDVGWLAQVLQANYAKVASLMNSDLKKIGFLAFEEEKFRRPRR